MKAIILNEFFDAVAFPFLDKYPPLAFPVSNKPLVSHLLTALKNNNINQIAITVNKHFGWDKALIAKIKNFAFDGTNMFWIENDRPKGTAGILSELKDFVGSSNFLLVCANNFIGDIDLSPIYDFHVSKKAGITMLVEHDDTAHCLENVQLDENGIVKKVHVFHHSRNCRRMLRPTGLYIFSPHTLDYIFEIGYMDIKEQLVPHLNSRGIPVYAYETDGVIKHIDSFTDYYHLNKEVLLTSCKQSNNHVRFGKNVKTSPTAFILGPAFIGDNCVIEDDAKIIGPVSIGNGSHIGANVLIRESILWENVCLKPKSRVEYSIIGDNSVVYNNDTVTNEIFLGIGKKTVMDLSQLNDAEAVGRNVQFPIYYQSLKSKFFMSTKRLIDIVVSSLGMFFLLPCFTVLGMAIMLDSPGPVVFKQKRCGQDGKDFTMYKLRTMVKDAEKLQEGLALQKNIDGPMFKMNKDPRVTRLGEFLRKTSLDEMPQLFNVLKGEMSLVGPRPLAMNEMQFAPGWRELRLKVKPGITGLWQINGRSDISFHDWIKHDIDYVKNQSLKLDIQILIKTIRCVSRGIGAK